MSAQLLVQCDGIPDTGAMDAEESAQWRTAHPDVTVLPEAGEQIARGRYTALLFIDRLAVAPGLNGYLRCVACGYTSVSTHRVVRVHRDDYAVSSLQVVDSQYPLIETTDVAERIRPDPEFRGDSVAIEFRCEEGHGWFLELGNHKGTTIASLIEIDSPT